MGPHVSHETIHSCIQFTLYQQLLLNIKAPREATLLEIQVAVLSCRETRVQRNAGDVALRIQQT